MFASKYINIFAPVICVVVVATYIRGCIGEKKKNTETTERKETLEVILVGTEEKKKEKEEEKKQNLSGMYNEENFDFSNSFHYHQHTKFISMSSSTLVLMLFSSRFSLLLWFLFLYDWTQFSFFWRVFTFPSFETFPFSPLLCSAIKHLSPDCVYSFSIYFFRMDDGEVWRSTMCVYAL